MQRVLLNASIKSVIVLLHALLMLLPVKGHAQEKEARQVNNAVYVELLGNAGYLYNLTYDRTIYTKEKRKFSIAIGAQYLPESSLSNEDLLSTSHQLNLFFGVKHHFETGIGLVIDYGNGDQAYLARIGYRYQDPGGGVFFRIGFTPVFVQDILERSSIVLPWAGLSYGRTF